MVLWPSPCLGSAGASNCDRIDPTPGWVREENGYMAGERLVRRSSSFRPTTYRRRQVREKSEFPSEFPQPEFSRPLAEPTTATYLLTYLLRAWEHQARG